MHRVLRGLFGSVLLLLLISAIASAQATAQIAAPCKDTSGGVMPGADVSATQTETGFKRTAITDGTGAYTLTNLPIGPYKLDCNLQGFKSYSRTGIVLQVNGSPTINIELSLGAVEETVLVQAESPLIETRNMGVGQVMDNKRIQELPLNGRNPADLLQYLPAAVPQPQLNATSRSFGGTQGGLAYSIAGGQSYGVAYLLDGATHNNPYDNLNLPLPFPGRAAGVQGRDQRADRAERHALGRGGERRHQVGHEPASRRSVRIPPPSQRQRDEPVQREERRRHAERTTG